MINAFPVQIYSTSKFTKGLTLKFNSGRINENKLQFDFNFYMIEIEWSLILKLVLTVLYQIFLQDLSMINRRTYFLIPKNPFKSHTKHKHADVQKCAQILSISMRLI